MGKPNKRHHELCQKYKQEGRREKNKKIRAERNERRIAKFARRRENKPPRVSYASNPEDRGDNRQAPLGDFAYRPKMDHMVPFQKERSFEQRIQNQLDAEILAMKREEQKRKSKNNNKEG